MEAGLESNDGTNDIVDEENQEPVCNDELDTVENPTNEEIKEFHEAPKCLEEKKILQKFHYYIHYKYCRDKNLQFHDILYAYDIVYNCTEHFSQ